MKTIILPILALLAFISAVNSQQINFLRIDDLDPRGGDYRDYLHQRVKYDPWGKVHIITYDGARFYNAVYSNGYVTPFKPIAKALINIPELTNAKAYYYDFDIDTSGVIHIAFTVFRYGETAFDSNRVYMFYSNSQTDSVFYLGKTAFPQVDYRQYYHSVNVLRTTDNKIVINYLHYSHPGSTFNTLISIKWTQLVNPSANNLQPKYRQVDLPVSYPSYPLKYFSAYANKNLFVNLYQYDNQHYPYDTLYIKYNLLKYDINNPANDVVLRTESTSILRGSNISVALPIYSADYDAGNVLISNIVVTYPGPSNLPSISSPLDNTIFTLDRENNLHAVKFSGAQITYHRYDNNGNISLSHTINKSYFYPINLEINNAYILQNSSIATLNSNNAVFLFNYGEYLVHQLQGNFIYKLITPDIFGPYPLRTLELLVKDNKISLFNATRTYSNLNDSTGILPLYEIREQNNEFRTDFDTSSIINIQFQDVARLEYPIAKVDKNNQIHLLIFKFLKYGAAQSKLGQWYYYKITNNLQVQGGYRVTAESDTLYILSPVDFDVDGNGVVHVVYFRNLENFKRVMVYTNNSSGTFATPIVIPDTLSSSTGNNWFKVKATRDGKAYIVYLNWSEAKVNVIYGDLNGFTNPKRLFVHQNIDNGGGRNKISFEVDYQGNLHCFDMSDYPQVLRYAYKIIRDSIVFVNRMYSNYDSPQFVTTAQDKNWNIYVLGVTNNEKIYYLHSFDNFQSFRTYDIANYGILNLLNLGDIFWDYFKPFAVSERGKIYFYLGKALWWDLLGWIPTLPTDVKKDETLIPDNFALYQNYSNPFNLSTVISFDLPRDVDVKLSVYDILGRLVGVLVDSRMRAGRYSVEFRGDGLSSGIYFYRLEAGDFVNVKKMIFVK